MSSTISVEPSRKLTNGGSRREREKGNFKIANLLHKDEEKIFKIYVFQVTMMMMLLLLCRFGNEK